MLWVPISVFVEITLKELTPEPEYGFFLSVETSRLSNMFESRMIRHNTFSTTVCHKKTFTGLYTKWDSLLYSQKV